MEFRPCIDIHEGQVKQIVGGSLKDSGNGLMVNYVANQGAAFFASLYQENQLKGGHIILLTPPGHTGYEETKEQAVQALHAYPNGLQIGGGITPENAEEYLSAGASHVIVTSYVFHDGKISYDRLRHLVDTVGKEHLVLDLSCRKKEDDYYIVTDRWQKYTDVKLNEKTMSDLASYCDEFLIHAVDVEGKASGIEQELVRMLGNWGGKEMTYAGGIHTMEDISLLKTLGRNCVNATIGSALDMFGGNLKFEEVLRKIREE